MELGTAFVRPKPEFREKIGMVGVDRRVEDLCRRSEIHDLDIFVGGTAGERRLIASS